MAICFESYQFGADGAEKTGFAEPENFEDVAPEPQRKLHVFNGIDTKYIT